MKSTLTRLLAVSWLFTGLVACNRTSQQSGQRVRVAVGEIKEMTVSARSPLVGTSENQEVVDVSPKPLSATDSSALQQGNAVPMVFLIKGVTIGSARVILSEKSGDAATSRVRKAYAVQVVSQ